MGLDSFEPLPGLARLGAGLLYGTDQETQGKGDSGAGYAITSLPPERGDAARLLEIWRGHWGIEKRLHWVRDVVFGEDQSQVRTGSATTTAGSAAELGNRHAAAERGEKHSGGPAPLRLETLGDANP